MSLENDRGATARSLARVVLRNNPVIAVTSLAFAASMPACSERLGVRSAW
jgi:hypothetical protein